MEPRGSSAHVYTHVYMHLCVCMCECVFHNHLVFLAHTYNFYKVS